VANSARFTKDPQAVLDYQIDWSAWLATDTITSSAWTMPAGITKASDTKTTTTTTIWLSGGTAGQQYQIVNTIVTAGGRTEERTLTIVVENR
jgi:hypothetical protein